MENYRELVRRLKNHYWRYRTSVRRTAVPRSLAGDCDKVNGIWVVRIDRTLDEYSAMDCLVHEFAHVPSWPEWVATRTHGPVWAEHYRQCYLIYEQIAEESHRR